MFSNAIPIQSVNIFLLFTRNCTQYTQTETSRDFSKKQNSPDIKLMLTQLREVQNMQDNLQSLQKLP